MNQGVIVENSFENFELKQRSIPWICNIEAIKDLIKTVFTMAISQTGMNGRINGRWQMITGNRNKVGFLFLVLVFYFFLGGVGNVLM